MAGVSAAAAAAAAAAGSAEQGPSTNEWRTRMVREWKVHRASAKAQLCLHVHSYHHMCRNGDDSAGNCTGAAAALAIRPDSTSVVWSRHGARLAGM